MPNQSELVVCVMLTKLKERPVDAKSSFMTEIDSSIWESLPESIVSKKAWKIWNALRDVATRDTAASLDDVPMNVDPGANC